MKKIFLLALACAVILLTVQYQWAARLERNNQELRAEQEKRSNAGTPEDLRRLRDAVEQVEQLRPQTRDLHRLRDEVRRLREQTFDLEQLRALNAELKESKASTGDGTSDPERVAFQREYVRSDDLVNAGFATPEATVQTFFWAIKNGDIEHLSQCVVAQHAARLAAIPDAEREAAAQELKTEFAQFPGFRVVRSDAETMPSPGSDRPLDLTEDLESFSGPKALVKAQTAYGGESLPIALVWETNAWKIAAPLLLH